MSARSSLRAFPPGDAPVCACEGQPCDCTPWLYTVKEPPRKPVTMAMADSLEASGYLAIADLARKYAIDKPLRWWQWRPNRRPYPNATFGTIRYFYLSGLFGGWVLHWLVTQWA